MPIRRRIHHGCILSHSPQFGFTIIEYQLNDETAHERTDSFSDSFRKLRIRKTPANSAIRTQITIFLIFQGGADFRFLPRAQPTSRW